MARALAAALVTLALTAKADGTDVEVVRVGGTSVLARDVAAGMARLPIFQLRSFGASDADVRRHFVDAVLVPELLMAEDARQRNLSDVPRVRRRLRDALARALGDSMLDAETTAGVPDGDVRAYYDAHRAEYDKPERIRISRILVDDDGLARRILTEAKGVTGLVRWTELAREHSLDAATKMRGGLVGFVFPDGTTDVPQVAVDAALYEAAAKVRDGELVPEPVKEGTHLAVVWRRGTLPKSSRSYESERDAIRALLVRERAERSFTALREELRKRSLSAYDPGPLESLGVDEPPAPSAASRPSASPVKADPVPRPSDRGLR